MESNQTPEPMFSEKPKNAWNTVTPLSKYLALALFTTLPFLGGYVGYVYAPEKIVEIERIVVTEAEPIAENTETSVVTSLETQRILSAYLHRYTADDSFYATYSALSDDELIMINDAIELAAQNSSYTQQQKETIDTLYQELFVQKIEDRVQDAPSGRANKLIGTKLCIAKAVLTARLATVVGDCGGEDTYPAEITWSADDITAEAQIAPYYMQGSYYFGQTENQYLAVYYLKQVVRHYEVAKEQWGEEDFENIAGEDYMNMVKDADKKLAASGSQTQ